MPQPKRLLIKELIEKGGATRKSICDELGISYASLATNFSYLRLMGCYPVKNTDGTLSLTDENGWNDAKAKRDILNSKTAKPIPERHSALKRRVVKCTDTLEKAQTKLNSKPEDILTQLRLEKAKIELKIAITALADFEYIYSPVLE